MGQYDTTIKEFAKTSLAPLIGWLRPQLRLVSVIEMPQELPATVRRVDVLAKAIDEHEAAELTILECQAQEDRTLPGCMLLRSALVHVHYGLPVTTILLALTREAVVEAEYVYGRYGDRKLVHGVEVRKLYEESADAALDTGPVAIIPLIPVMRPRDGNRARVLQEVLERIIQLELSPERKKLLMGWAATFATLSLSRPQIDVIVRDVSRRRNFMLNALQDLPLLRDTYQEGREKGMEEGLEQGLERGLVRVYESRLGRMPGPLREALMKIDDLGRLEDLFPLFSTGSPDDIARALRPPEKG